MMKKLVFKGVVIFGVGSYLAYMALQFSWWAIWDLIHSLSGVWFGEWGVRHPTGQRIILILGSLAMAVVFAGGAMKGKDMLNR